MVANIVVIGAGVVVLSTATRIQLALPDARVYVIAGKLYSDTCSFRSGGGFLMIFFKDSTNDEKELQRNSWEHYRELATGPLAGESGVITCMGYDLLREGIASLLFCDDDDNYDNYYRYCTNSSTCNDRRDNSGDAFTNKHVKQLMTELNKRKSNYDVVVNCAWAGIQDIGNDDTVFPVKAPWIKYWVFTDDLTYFFAGENYNGLGGYKIPDDTSLMVKQEEGAERDHTWAGLRPGRRMIRVVRGTMDFNNGQLKVAIAKMSGAGQYCRVVDPPHS